MNVVELCARAVKPVGVFVATLLALSLVDFYLGHAAAWWLSSAALAFGLGTIKGSMDERRKLPEQGL